MPIAKQKIVPCLWFDTQAEDAAKFYVSVFKNSKVGRISHYDSAGHDIHGRPDGSVMTIEFELDGQRFVGLNGGPHFNFTEAISLQIHCETQEEIDYYWNALTAGGEEGPCGWLKDKFGLSWQVAPTALLEMLLDPDRNKRERVMDAFMKMKKFDIAALQRVYAG